MKNLIRQNTNYQVRVNQNIPTVDFEKKYFQTINESYVDILKVESKKQITILCYRDILKNHQPYQAGIEMLV